MVVAVTTVEVYVSKAAVEAACEVGFAIEKGDQEFTLEDAADLEAALMVFRAKHGKSGVGRAAAALARNLANAIECTRSIDDVEREILTVLDEKWDDADAVETHTQLMVHRGWDRSFAIQAINRTRELQ